MCLVGKALYKYQHFIYSLTKSLENGQYGNKFMHELAWWNTCTHLNLLKMGNEMFRKLIVHLSCIIWEFQNFYTQWEFVKNNHISSCKTKDDIPPPKQEFSNFTFSSMYKSTIDK